MASLIGAVAHDLDHPGVNQHFLISTSNHLAILYQVSDQYQYATILVKLGKRYTF